MVIVLPPRHELIPLAEAAELLERQVPRVANQEMAAPNRSANKAETKQRKHRGNERPSMVSSIEASPLETRPPPLRDDPIPPADERYVGTIGPSIVWWTILRRASENHELELLTPAGLSVEYGTVGAKYGKPHLRSLGLGRWLADTWGYEVIYSAPEIQKADLVETRIDRIVTVIEDFGFDAMAIPRCGRGKIMDECLKDKQLFGSPEQFRRAWLRATDTERVRVEHYEKYKKNS